MKKVPFIMFKLELDGQGVLKLTKKEFKANYYVATATYDDPRYVAKEFAALNSRFHAYNTVTPTAKDKTILEQNADRYLNTAKVYLHGAQATAFLFLKGDTPYNVKDVTHYMVDAIREDTAREHAEQMRRLLALQAEEELNRLRNDRLLTAHMPDMEEEK